MAGLPGLKGNTWWFDTKLVASKQSTPEPIPSSVTQRTEFTISRFENIADLEEIEHVNMLNSRTTI